MKIIAMAISARSKGMPIPNPIIKLEWSEKKPSYGERKYRCTYLLVYQLKRNSL